MKGILTNSSSERKRRKRSLIRIITTVFLNSFLALKLHTNVDLKIRSMAIIDDGGVVPPLITYAI